jgi:uncharacterized RDD family membrane protein YckC
MVLKLRTCYNLLAWIELDMAPQTRYCSECGRATAADELAQFGDRLICGYCKQNYAQKLREGVAPAANVRYAGFWIRVVATIIDTIILVIVQGLVRLPLFGSFFATRRFDPTMRPDEMIGPMMGAIGLSWLLGVVISSCYEAFFVARMGATPGKMALGMKVVRPNGMPVDLGRAFGRYFAKILSWIVLCIGYIMVGFDSEKKGLHDMICDTRVVRIGN